MKRNIQIEALAQIPLEKQRIELVERKCLGHPDSIADGVAEAISRALCKNISMSSGLSCTTIPTRERLLQENLTRSLVAESHPPDFHPY